MNRLGTAVFAAVEAVVAVGVGVGIALVPLTLLWGIEYGLQIDWSAFWTAAGSVWLVGHGVDVSFTLSAAAAKASGVSGAGAPIAVTLPALGFALLTAYIGSRAGRRFAETEHRVTGTLVATGVVAALGLAIALSSTSAATHPTVWQAVVLPALWFGVPAVVAAEVCRLRRGIDADPLTGRMIDLVQRVPAAWRAVVGFGLRAGTASTAIVVAVAGVVVGFLVLGSFAEVITLYERSHAGVVGGLAITVGELAYLPDFVGWAVAWIIGPGFAIGTGSSVSPIGTTLGPIPGIPVFGALPASGHAFGLAWVLVPVVAGFVAGGLLRPRLVRTLGDADSAAMRAAGGVVTGVVSGVLAGLVAWITSGSFGPGRLAAVGADPWTVGLFAALEVGVPAVVALAIGADLVRLPERSAWTARERWQDDGAEPVVATEGGLLDALDAAGAGRTTGVHRFVVDEDGQPTTSRAADDQPHPTPAGPVAPTDARPARSPRRRIPGVRYAEETEPVDAVAAVDDPASDVADARRASAEQPTAPIAPRPRPGTGTDTGSGRGTGTGTGTDAAADDDVELPDWAHTDGEHRAASPAARTHPDRPAGASGPDGRAEGLPAGRGRGLRDRLRRAADGARSRADDLRGRAGELHERVTGADAERPQRTPAGRPQRADATPDRAHEIPRAHGAARADEQPAFPWSTEEFVSGRDDAQGSEPAGRPSWDTTDQIPEHELPWWRQPKDRG